MALALGLMSGTSCDGVSAALVEFRGRRFRLLGYRTTAYAPPLTELLRRSREWTLAQTAQANILLGELFARSAMQLLRATRTDPRRVEVIGSHGHTVYHGPRDPIPCTLQLGEPAVIAERTGIPVVADFRPRDLAAGGEGAPLIPFFDQWRFGTGAPRALQNIGGIANVTIVGHRLRPIAFDTGPGNCLLDTVAQRLTRGRQRFDRHGAMAQRGRVDQAMVRRMWAHPYFRRPPPKSTGPEVFNESFLQSVCGRRWASRGLDVLATLTYFTAYSIAESSRRFIPARLHEMIVSGGGVFNRTLMNHLKRLLHPLPVRSIARHGLHPQAKEPVAFALLALRAIRHQPNHLPSTTGASHAHILGTLTPA
jgi:anhydro-N-acetylmuramic acid kinase